MSYKYESFMHTYFRDLINYVTGGPVLAMELVGENAIQRWRELIGPTDPSQARSEASSSLRARFGRGITRGHIFLCSRLQLIK